MREERLPHRVVKTGQVSASFPPRPVHRHLLPKTLQTTTTAAADHLRLLLLLVHLPPTLLLSLCPFRLQNTPLLHVNHLLLFLSSSSSPLSLLPFLLYALVRPRLAGSSLHPSLSQLEFSAEGVCCLLLVFFRFLVFMTLGDVQLFRLLFFPRPPPPPSSVRVLLVLAVFFSLC